MYWLSNSLIGIYMVYTDMPAIHIYFKILKSNVRFMTDYLTVARGVLNLVQPRTLSRPTRLPV